MNILKKVYRNIVSIPINFRCLPFKQALKLPIHISGNMILGHLSKNSIVINSSSVYRGMIQLGINKGSFGMGGQNYLDIKPGGKMIFEGACNLCSGIRITVDKNAHLTVGPNVFLNSNVIISVCTSIVFGKNFSAGWNCMISDWDGHAIVDSDSLEILNLPAPISFGTNVWIGANTTVLKGCSFGNYIIVPCASVITKSCVAEKVIYGGMPNRILKSHVIRKYE